MGFISHHVSDRWSVLGVSFSFHVPLKAFTQKKEPIDPIVFTELVRIKHMYRDKIPAHIIFHYPYQREENGAVAQKVSHFLCLVHDDDGSWMSH